LQRKIIPVQCEVPTGYIGLLPTATRSHEFIWRSVSEPSAGITIQRFVSSCLSPVDQMTTALYSTEADRCGNALRWRGWNVAVGVSTNNNWVDMAAEGLDFAIRFDRGFLDRNRRDPSV
jgi:hypothetical protein